MVDRQPNINLQIAMIQRGMTGKRLAERTGMYPADISGIRTGRLNPTRPQMRKIADAMRMSVRDLFDTADDAERLVS